MCALQEFNRHGQEQQQAINDYEDWQLAEKIAHRIAAYFLMDAPETDGVQRLAFDALREFRRDDEIPF